MKHFLEFVARSLVDNPEDVQVSEIGGEGDEAFRIGLHPADVGLVIGKGALPSDTVKSLLKKARSKASAAAKETETANA